MRYLSVQRFSDQRVSMWPPRSTRFPLRHVPEASGRPSVGQRIFCPPSWGRSVFGGGSAFAPRGTWSVPSEGRCGGNPEPYNGLSYAWGNGQRHSKRDGDPSPGCNPSGTSPTSLTGSCYMSPRPVTMSAGARGSVLTYPRAPLLPVPPRCLLDYMDPNNLGSQLGIRQAPYSNAMYD